MLPWKRLPRTTHAEEMFVVLSDPAIYEYEGEPPRSVQGLRDRFANLVLVGVEHVGRQKQSRPQVQAWWVQLVTK